MEELSEALAQLRSRAGDLSLRQIVAKLGLLEHQATPGHLSEVFRGIKQPSPLLAEFLARALGASQADVDRIRRLAADRAVDRRPQIPLEPAVRTALPAYVARPRYEPAIRQLRDAGVTAVWLWGDAGTGKTRLACAANRDLLAEGAVPVLTAGYEPTLKEQVTALVVSTGVAAGRVNEANRWVHLLGQLRKAKAPRVLVIEDMAPDDVRVGELVSAARGTLLFFTSTRRPEWVTGAEPAAVLEIVDMTATESAEMIRSRLPELGDSDVDLLNAALAGRPLAVEHSCSFLRKTRMGVADYCDALSKAPASTLAAAGQAQTKTLSKVYKLALEYLAEPPDRLRALDLVLFTWPGLVTADMLSLLWVDSLYPRTQEEAVASLNDRNSYLISLFDSTLWPGVTAQTLSQIPYAPPAQVIHLAAALADLADLGLIRYDHHLIVMHRFTRTVLTDLRRDHAAAVHTQVLDRAYELLADDGWGPGEPIQGHLVPWAPHVALAINQLAATPAPLTLEQTRRLVLLGAMLLRNHLQVGGSVAAGTDSVKTLLAAVSTRTSRQPIDAEMIRRFAVAGNALEKETAAIATLHAGFRPPLEKVDAAQAELINHTRLEYDTEWDPTPSFVAVESGVQYFERIRTTEPPADTDARQLKHHAGIALAISRLQYDRCQWREAIAALEYAHACYLKVGGDTGAVRGAIDAARRLARVHLRAGPAASATYLDDACAWLDTAGEIRRRRSDAFLNGQRTRYQLHDVLLTAQLQQAATQIELTRQVQIWDAQPDDVTPQAVRRFVTEPFENADGRRSEHSRLDEARQALSLLGRIQAKRLVPEFRMHLVRLCLLAEDPRTGEHLSNLKEWFDREQLTYQADLLAVQHATTSLIGIAPLFVLEDDEFPAYTSRMAPEAREELATIRQSRVAVCNNYYALAGAMRRHRNPYWYARGLSATLMMGLVADRETTWLDRVRAELEPAAAAIGRTDWVDLAEGYGETNGGMWLYGY